MGQGLPRAVESTIVEREEGAAFRVGVAELNGWRAAMEDAHNVVMRDRWGYFAVYDGHGGDECSAFAARRMPELIGETPPKTDAEVTELCLRLDREFLAIGKPSGSTATFAFIHVPEDGGKYVLRVGNIGDSRVLLGRRDGGIVDGGGTDRGLTTDHKPDHPGERERIERCGGTVEPPSCPTVGVARVNGDLAVSRAFGDAAHKQTGPAGGGGQEDHPVSAAPELGRFECEASDFVLFVCDGVSEGAYPNAAVVETAAKVLRETDDPGAASEAVIRRALQVNSQDNISCMCVCFRGAGAPERCISGAYPTGKTFTPGPYHTNNATSRPDSIPFRDAYTAMAERAGLSLAQALDTRYERCKQELSQLESEASRSGSQTLAFYAATILRKELGGYGSVPAGEPGSDERIQYFDRWAAAPPPGEGVIVPSPPGGGCGGGTAPADTGALPAARAAVNARETLTLAQLRLLAQHNPQSAPLRRISDKLQERGLWDAGRKVRAAGLDQLRTAVLNHAALQWQETRDAPLAGAEGTVKMDDPSDGTSQVQFDTQGVIAWVPTGILTDLSGACPGAAVPAAEAAAAPARLAPPDPKRHCTGMDDID